MALAALLALVSSSCAIRWYDSENQCEHVLGWTHVQMRMPAPSEGTRAVAGEVSTLGAAVTVSGQDTGVMVGWHRSCRLVILDENTAVRLEWPTTALIDVRVGSLPPAPAASPGPDAEGEPETPKTEEPFR